MCVVLWGRKKPWLFFGLILMLTSFVQAQHIFDGLPGDIDPQGRYIFFLHGQIVEDGGRRPVSEQYGVYEYDEILQALSGRGFYVISEARPKHADVMAYAHKTVKQIRALLAAGVPAKRITVVGASKGGGIAVFVSVELQNREINYVLIAACGKRGIEAMVRRGEFLSGNVLSIYDEEDDLGLLSCEAFFKASRSSRLGKTLEVVVNLGRGHGFHYRPVAEWMEPAVAWALNEGTAGELSKD